MRCANCNAEASGAHCSSCGQRTDVRPLAVEHLLRRSLVDLTSLELPLWRTFLGLLRQPGEVADQYASGRRVHYTNPIKWALVATALAFFANRLVGAQGPVRLEISSTDGTPAWVRPVYQFLTSNAAPLFVLLLLPVLALMMRIAFGRRRSVAEELVLVLYAYGCAGLLQAAYAPLAALGAPPDLAGPLPLIWTAWAAVRFHAERPGWASVLRTLLAHVLWVLIVAVVVGGVLFLGSWLGVIR